ncbi:hypothetical protein RRG08_031141 [Elysia crispata]|uniref:Uncharacterized protein n=1 Tax=Elysia crispata TaxID=231223 RepID=A0AAE0ZFG2_9GAST|nr:hypothetical protein RRG08_031141 [Elysia crispata]
MGWQKSRQTDRDIDLADKTKTLDHNCLSLLIEKRETWDLIDKYRIESLQTKKPSPGHDNKCAILSAE